MTAKLDIVGDLHGQLGALLALGRELGYDAEDWSHPEGRLLVFVGDLVDRGPHSLEVSELVLRLVQEGRAVCLMGNHEYNLVAHRMNVLPPMYAKPKKSNAATIADIHARPDRWAPVLDFFRDLPLALDLPGLRVIHAAAHVPSLGVVLPVIGREPPAAGVPDPAVDPARWVRAHVWIESPFDRDGLRPGLVRYIPESRDDLPHEILIKGFELPADEPFVDNIGVVRDLRRVCWWQEPDSPVLSDKLCVFGHYWNVPPTAGNNWAPPYPSGHPRLRAWFEESWPQVADRGRRAHEGAYACVDFNGITRADPERACAGAYRWPEREIAWACAPK